MTCKTYNTKQCFTKNNILQINSILQTNKYIAKNIYILNKIIYCKQILLLSLFVLKLAQHNQTNYTRSNTIEHKTTQ